MQRALLLATLLIFACPPAWAGVGAGAPVTAVQPQGPAPAAPMAPQQIPYAALTVEPSPAAQPYTPPRNDHPLLRMYEHFVGFAKDHIHLVNANHIESRSRMTVTSSPYGYYVGRYHEIDRESMNCEVKRSSSKKVPFVAVLRYKEHVYEAVATSEEAVRQAVFTIVRSIPTCEIFSYRNGNWE